MTRQKLILGNWKMFTTAATAVRLAADVVRGIAAGWRVQVGVCPPAPYLGLVAGELRGTPVALGAQNVYPEKEGAVTGETGIQMLLDLGCRYVLVGHSERRRLLGEDDEFINRKARASLAAGLGAILCVGETREQRQEGRTWAVLEGQLAGALAGLTAEQVRHVAVAYEAVWAIGTGESATPGQAQEVAAGIRERVKGWFGEGPAGALRILDGGGVNAANAATPVAYREGDRLFLSDNGNPIFDCGVGPLDEPARLERDLRAIPGVVGAGQFLGWLRACSSASPTA